MINIFRAAVYIIYALSIDFWDTVYDQNSMTKILRLSVYIIDKLIIDFWYTVYDKNSMPNILILSNYIIGRCSKDIRQPTLIINSNSK